MSKERVSRLKPSSGASPGGEARLLQRKCACGGTPGPTGECAECRKKRLGLQRKGSRMAPEVAPPIVHDVLRSSGRPLDPAARAFFEPRLGHDFGRVRVHTDAQAAASADAVGALAYTAGRNIVFAGGRYAPSSPAGRRLLAHELAHVVQQREISSLPEGISSPGDPLERAADRAAERALGDTPDRGAAAETAPLRHGVLQRLVNEAKVGCRTDGIPSLGLSGADAVDAIRTANEEAIRMALRAEALLFVERLTFGTGTPDPTFVTILREELGLDINNPRHRNLMEVVERRFELIRTRVLESDFTGYTCIGARNVSLAGGAAAGECCAGSARACSAGGISHMVLCRPWWTGDVSLRPGTLIHEPMHMYFNLGDFTGRNRLNDAHCYTAFAERLAGITPFASCAGR